MSTSCASAPTTRITVAVPVHFINQEKSPGIKRGGILNVVRHEIELVCSADNIPERLDVDLDGLDIGDSIHISGVTLPEGTRLDDQRAISPSPRSRAPTVVREEQAAAAAAAAAAARRPAPEGAVLPHAAPVQRQARPRLPGAAPAARRRQRRRAVPRPGSGGGGAKGKLILPMRLLVGLGNPGAALRAQPAQCRVHGGGRDRPPPCLRAVPRALPGRVRRRHDRRRAGRCC